MVGWKGPWATPKPAGGTMGAGAGGAGRGGGAACAGGGAEFDWASTRGRQAAAAPVTVSNCRA